MIICLYDLLMELLFPPQDKENAVTTKASCQTNHQAKSPINGNVSKLLAYWDSEQGTLNSAAAFDTIN